MNKVSLIVSAYKKVNELEMVLYGLSVQTFKDFEVIIAEDDTSKEILEIVNKFKKILSNDVIHLTQPDEGFRKSRIFNESIRKSNTDYLIFIDSDCIPHSEFIKSHVDNIENNTVLCGRRVSLGKEISISITKESIISLNYQKISIENVKDYFRKTREASKNLEEGLFIKKNIFQKFLSRKDTHIVGSNYSLNKKLLEKINGFDENYIGPGIGEDSDIEFRLRLLGVKFKSIKNLAIIYHLYHDKTIEEKKNYDYFQNVKKQKNYMCENGLEKHT